jgi:hypothetical protein
MKRWVLILMALLTVLSSVSGSVIAAPKETSRHGGDAPTTVARWLDADTRAPRRAGLPDFSYLQMRDGELVPADNTRKSVTAQAAAPEWIFGKASHTKAYNWFIGEETILTEHRVGYSGTADLSFPKVGDLYYGSVLIGNISGMFTIGVAADIKLPPNTSFAIDSNDPNKRVRCFLWNFVTDVNAEHLTELTGADCDQTPVPLLYGAHFAPSSNGGRWSLASGQAVLIAFPISSRTELKGMARPSDCLIGSVFVASILGEVWDHPQQGDTCPLDDGHGASQGVFVAPGNVTKVGPPADNSQSTTSTQAKKCKKIKDKQKRKKCLNRINR